MKTFLKRLFSSVLLLALFVFVLIGPNPYAYYTFVAMAVLFAAAAVYEFGMILVKSDHMFDLTRTVFFTAFTVGAFALRGEATLIGILVLLYIIHAWTKFLVSNNQEKAMLSIFSSAFAYFGFTIPFCLMVWVYGLGVDNCHMLFLYLLLVTKIGDIAAYVTGSLSAYALKNHGGNHKMIPSISPGKSYEGAVGGFIFTLLLSYFLWPLCNIECMFSTFWTSMILGTILFFGCMAGDLSESAFKRTCKIKDSGAVLPGIGGVLDLVDSLLITAPLFVFFLFVCRASVV